MCMKDTLGAFGTSFWQQHVQTEAFKCKGKEALQVERTWKFSERMIVSRVAIAWEWTTSWRSFSSLIRVVNMVVTSTMRKKIVALINNSTLSAVKKYCLFSKDPNLKCCCCTLTKVFKASGDWIKCRPGKKHKFLHNRLRWSAIA